MREDQTIFHSDLHPSKFIQEELDARGWDWDDLAFKMEGEDFAINRLALEVYFIFGPDDPNCRIGELMAHDLAKAFGVSKEFFINLEKLWLQGIKEKIKGEINMPVNVVLLEGRLTRDPELKVLPNSEKILANFGIAVNRVYKDKEEVTYADCVCWGKTAENLVEYKTKGDLILVNGSLHMDSWESKDGEKRTKLKVNVHMISYLGGKTEDSE